MLLDCFWASFVSWSKVFLHRPWPSQGEDPLAIFLIFRFIYRRRSLEGFREYFFFLQTVYWFWSSFLGKKGANSEVPAMDAIRLSQSHRGPRPRKLVLQSCGRMD